MRPIELLGSVLFFPVMAVFVVVGTWLVNHLFDLSFFHPVERFRTVLSFILLLLLLLFSVWLYSVVAISNIKRRDARGKGK